MTGMRYGIRILAVSFAAVFALGATACGADSGSGNTSNANEGSDASQNSEISAEVQAAYSEALSGEALVTAFVSENITDATVTNEDEAQAVVDNLIGLMGGDSTTDLGLVDTIATETGNTYYIFQQETGGVIVYGASVKLIVDKNGTVIGLVSAILPNVTLPSVSDTAVSQEKAENIVATELANSGLSNARIVSEYTTQSIVPLPNSELHYCLAWIIYAESPSGDGDDQAYIANYVSLDGEYLYRMPISEPNGVDALRGASTGFDFEAFDQKEQTFDVGKDGETKQVTVPVLVDKQTGETIFLGDAKRQILCVDFAEYDQNDRLMSSFEVDGESFNSMDVAIYANFIRIYDLFEAMGWDGPNGEHTPTLLKMNYLVEDEPAMNCVYMGKSDGWEVFTFGRGRDYGSTTDIIAHEFVHCVTGTTMTTNLYVNESGAINEGMSDILGNLAEMALDGNEGAWIIGEGAAEGDMRSMDNPNEHVQPAYRWDVYYNPDAPTATIMNDNGGVHINSSLLNIISYKLDKAGMSIEDQMYFWMNVALAMVPTTDYAQMAELLPWVLKQSGYDQYSDALNQAIDEAGYTKLEQPAELPAGAGVVKFIYPDSELAKQGDVRIVFFNEAALKNADDEAWMWPIGENGLVSATLPADDYYVAAITETDVDDRESKTYTDKGWVKFDGTNDMLEETGTRVHVSEGEILELATDGLA